MLTPEYSKFVEEMFNIWLVAMFCLLCGGSLFLIIKAFWVTAFDTNKKNRRRIF